MRAFIKQQATAKKKLEGSLPPKVMGKVAKRKPSKKADHPPKKPKVVLGLIVGETPTTVKLPPSFCKDSQYALKQISSIIKDEDYEDLGNHAIEAIGRRAYSVWYRYVYPSPYLYSILFLLF